MAKLIDGKLISQQIKDELKMKTAELEKQGIKGCLAVIQVGTARAIKSVPVSTLESSLVLTSCRRKRQKKSCWN